MLRLLIAVLIIHAGTHLASAGEMKLVFGDYYPEPFMITEQKVPVDGLIYRIARTAAERAGLDLVFVDVPRKRVDTALESGEADVICHFHPDWTGLHRSLRFVEIYQSRDVYVTRAGDTRDYRTPQEVAGAKVGTLLGFHYPGPFAAAFDAGATRVVVNQLDQMVAMLRRSRIDALITTDIIADYLVARQGGAPGLATADAGDAPGSRFCAIRQDYEAADRIAAALAGMRIDGTITRFLNIFGRQER